MLVAIVGKVNGTARHVDATTVRMDKAKVAVGSIASTSISANAFPLAHIKLRLFFAILSSGRLEREPSIQWTKVSLSTQNS